MSVIAITLQEGFANRMCQYAFARAYAEQHGCELQTNPWMGQKVFQIDDPPISGEHPQHFIEELEKWNGKVDIHLAGWAQHQKSLIYSRVDARRYFTFRPEILELLKDTPRFPICAHLRWADFLVAPPPGFIAITKESYLVACSQFKIDAGQLRFISEEEPIVIPRIKPGWWENANSEHHTRGPDGRITSLGFLPDFYALMNSDILFRANSTFSLWAAWLGNAKRVFSPNLAGIVKKPGPQFVPFVEGNHMPLTSWWSGHSELHLRET